MFPIQSTYVVVAMIVALPLSAAAAQLEVPSQYPTIQSAILAASHGDTIRIAPGNYSEAVDLLDKQLTLEGTGGAALTVLDGTGLTESIIRCVTGEPVGTRIIGLTLQNGQGSLTTHCTGAGFQSGRSGGAILVHAAAVQVEACVFENNGVGVLSGGAIFAEDATVLVENCSFSGNGEDGVTTYGGAIATCGITGSLEVRDCDFTTGSGGFGGGICNHCLDSVIEGCQFWANEAAFGGGVAAVVASECGGLFGPPVAVTIRDCTFWDNDVSWGGGVHLAVVDDGAALVEDCEFLDNNASNGGGMNGVLNWAMSGAYPELTVQRCSYQGNTASKGGGFYLTESDGGFATLRDLSFVGNQAVGSGSAVQGGGLFFFSLNGQGTTIDNILAVGNSSGVSGGGLAILVGATPVTLTNATVVGNTAGSFGGGLSTSRDASPYTVSNSIIRGNSTPQISDFLNSPDYRFSNLEGGAPSGGGVANLDTDPLFTQGPLGAYYLSHVAAGQASDSPCLNAGDPATSPPGGTTRTDELADAGIPDLGYHYPLTASLFRRGDVDESGSLNISDAVSLLGYLFAVPGTAPISCLNTADANNDGSTNLTDAIAILGALFGGGLSLPAPYPQCGTIHDAPALHDLGCASYSPCP